MPSRAWLTCGEAVARESGDASSAECVPARGQPCSMTLEEETAVETIEGTFESLLRVATDQAVAEFYVWSAQRRSFQPFDAHVYLANLPADQTRRPDES